MRIVTWTIRLVVFVLPILLVMIDDFLPGQPLDQARLRLLLLPILLRLQRAVKCLAK